MGKGIFLWPSTSVAKSRKKDTQSTLKSKFTKKITKKVKFYSKK